MGDYDITDNESLQSKLNRYKLQYKGEYRRRCEIESELNSITNLLRVTNEKLKTALVEGAKQKSTIRYLESQINMDKASSLVSYLLTLSSKKCHCQKNLIYLKKYCAYHAKCIMFRKNTTFYRAIMQ